MTNLFLHSFMIC